VSKKGEQRASVRVTLISRPLKAKRRSSGEVSEGGRGEGGGVGEPAGAMYYGGTDAGVTM